MPIAISIERQSNFIEDSSSVIRKKGVRVRIRGVRNVRFSEKLACFVFL